MYSLLLTSAAFAQPKPAPELRQLDAFAGTWQCKGIAYANPMAPEHETRAEVVMKWTLGNSWMHFTYTEKKTAANPMPFSVGGYVGYDPLAKKFVMGGADAMGGYSTGLSDGWNGDTMTFTGPWNMGTMKVNGRDTFTKNGGREMVHTAEIEQNGAWMKLSQETCTRK